MKIRDIFAQGKNTLSYEVFPPKKDTDFAIVERAVLEMAAKHPDYMSVTYGAGGSTRDNTVKLAGEIQRLFGVPTIAHLTCVGATKESIHKVLDEMKSAGIENVLALRGDRPKDFDGEPFTDFKNASELTADIKEYGDFCVGGACYPEGYPEDDSKDVNITNLKKKVDAGCEYLTTQMFFDNNIFYNFLYRVREKEIKVPVIPGIMPVTKPAQIKRAIELSGTNVPERFKNLVDRFGHNDAAMRQAGIAYATDQIIDLYANGIKHIHVYSMNKPDIAEAIRNNVSEILG